MERETSFVELLSEGNHCKRSPKFRTYGINLNIRGVVTCIISLLSLMLQACSHERVKEKHTINLQSVISRSVKPTRLRAVVPRRRRYIFPFMSTKMKSTIATKQLQFTMMMKTCLNKLKASEISSLKQQEKNI